MSINSAQLKAIRKLLRSRSTRGVATIVKHVHPADVAQIFPDLSPLELEQLFEVLFTNRSAGATLLELPEEILKSSLAIIPDDRMAKIVERQPPDDALILLDHLPGDRRSSVCGLMGSKKARVLDMLLSFPEGTAGRVMTTRVFALEQHATCRDAIAEIRKQGKDLEAIFYLYVIDEEGVLTGVVSLRNLILADEDTALRELMVVDPVRANARDDQEMVASLVSKYDLLSLPITDDDGRLLGAVTVDDVIDVIHEEATEDLYNMAGLDEADRVFSPVMRSARKRLLWTALNLGTAFVASMVVGLFEASIDKIVALAVFMPVVAGLGGNSGTQSLTVLVRGIALKELDFGSAFKAVLKQAAVGLLVGTVAGMVTAAVVWLWKGDPWFALVLLVAMVANMTIGSLFGATIPLLLRSLKLDPALGSGVVVTAITDTFGFFCFLGLATILMSHFQI